MQIDSLVVAKLDDAISMVKSVAPEVWRILVTQAISEGWQAVCWCALFLLTGIFLFIKGAIWYRNRPSEEVHIAYYTIGTIVFLIAIIILSMNIGKLFNPEYYAMQSLLGR